MRNLLVLVAAIVVVLAACACARADGIMISSIEDWSRLRDEGRIVEPEQEAAIFFDNGIEELYISPKYKGSVEKFAWVVPVPAKPKVELADDAIFYELFAATELMVAAPQPVTVIDRKVIGDYDVSVLSASDADALAKWLAENKYQLPPAAVEPMKAYVKQKWTFVACRVAAPEPTGRLKPLKLTFQAKRPVYPLRLSSANPAPFDVFLYLVVPRPRELGVYLKIDFQRPVDPYYAYRVGLGDGDDDRWRRRFPMLAKWSKGREVDIFQINWGWDHKLKPNQCNCDLVWTISRWRSGRDSDHWPDAPWDGSRGSKYLYDPHDHKPWNGPSKE